MITKRSATALVFLLGLLISLPALAIEQVAQVVFLRGSVTAAAEGGTPRMLRRGSEVALGEHIKAAPKAIAQLMFPDRSLVYLKSDSELLIEAFHFEEKAPEKDTAVVKVLKGGMRALSGSLGRRSAGKIEYKTRFSTIGIRGTAVDIDGVAKGSAERITFDVGHGVVGNRAGEVDLVEGASVLVELADSLPQSFEYSPPSSDPAFVLRVLERKSASEVKSWLEQNRQLIGEGNGILLMGLISQLPNNQGLSLATMQGLQGILTGKAYQRVLQAGSRLRPDLAPSFIRQSVGLGAPVTTSLRSVLGGLRNAPRDTIQKTVRTAADLGVSPEDAQDIIQELGESSDCQ